MKQVMVPAGGLFYRRGFLLAPEQQSRLADVWLESEIGGWWLYRDPLLPLTIESTEDSIVALLGLVMDLAEPTEEPEAIGRRLSKALGTVEFDDLVDRLCGRYVLVTARAGKLAVQTDATGLKSVFYSMESGALGSHARLVAATVGVEPSNYAGPEWETGDSVSYLPGLVTTYRSVRQLTPNVELTLSDWELRRTFPRRPPLGLEVPEVVDRLHSLFAAQVGFLAKRPERLLVSLTSGIDSRVTLALLRSLRDRLATFTYVLRYGRFAPMPLMDRDDEMATQISTRFGIEHIRAEIVSTSIRPEIEEVLRANTQHEHIWPLAQWYYDNLEGDVLHIRSNLYEIGRAFYRKGRHRPIPLDVERMVSIYPASDTGNAAHEAFDDFVRLTKFEHDLGYDPYDLFYWEHRMGRWHANLVIEGDLSHETWILINSRMILELLLAPPLRARIEAQVSKRLVERAWPELLEWPFETPSSAMVTSTFAD